MPSLLARYMATSALRRRSPAVSPAPSLEAMPRLALRTISRPPTTNGRRTACWSRSRDRPRLVETSALLDHHGELVAAETGRGVAAAHAAEESLRQLDEELVAGGVAQAVVDVLEVVEVDEDHGDRARPAASSPQRVLEALGEEQPVREVGEGVVKRLVGETLLEDLALVNAAQGEDGAGQEGVARDAVGPRLDEVSPVALAQDAPLRGGRRPGPGDGLGNERARDLPVLRVDDVQQARPVDLVALAPEEPLGGGSVEPDSGVLPDDEDDVGRVLDQRSEARLVRAGRVLGGEPRARTARRRHGRARTAAVSATPTKTSTPRSRLSRSATDWARTTKPIAAAAVGTNEAGRGVVWEAAASPAARRCA